MKLGTSASGAAVQPGRLHWLPRLPRGSAVLARAGAQARASVLPQAELEPQQQQPLCDRAPGHDEGYGPRSHADRCEPWHFGQPATCDKGSERFH